MAQILQPEYQWVLNLNNAVNLVAVQSVVPTFQNKPMIIQGRGRFIDGTPFERADEAITILGKARFSWLIPVMSTVQYAFMRNTYASGGYFARMTVRTRNSLDSFANYSATLQIPTLETIGESRRSDVYRNVVLNFVVRAVL